MHSRHAASVACCLAFALSALADAPSTSAPAAPAVATSGNAAVDSILDRLEAKGQAIKGISTNVTYNDVRFEPVEEKIVKKGELLFLRGNPSSKFLIRFDETIAGGVKRPKPEYYLFDGRWMTERNDATKQIIRREVVREGQSIDPFKLKKGPFPLPFGQRRADMIENFLITLLPPRPDDPPNTDHLHCEPRPESEFAPEYRRVDMFIDKKLELPVRIEIERKSDDSVIDARFENLDPAAAPAESRFQIETPPGKDWNVDVQPLPSAAPPAKP